MPNTGVTGISDNGLNPEAETDTDNWHIRAYASEVFRRILHLGRNPRTRGRPGKPLYPPLAEVARVADRIDVKQLK